MKRDVHITDTAFREIEAAYDWLEERNPFAAEKWKVVLLEAIDKLADHAHRYPLAHESEWYPGELRELLMGQRRGTYRILFEIVGKVVHVARVRHSAQDFLKPEEFES